MGHPALATAQRLTADNCYTLGHCFKVDGINAALPLHVAGINAKLNVGKLYQMVISIFTQQLLARNFDIKAFALKAGASHRVSIAQNGVGAIAVNLLVVGANTAQAETFTEGRRRYNHLLDGRIVQTHFASPPF